MSRFTSSLILCATAVLVTAGGSHLRADPVATAKIAEWAASDRGGKADYQELSHGRVVDLTKVVVSGKVTVVDLSSDYCAPCVSMAMYLIKISKSYPQRYAIRRVNINRPGFVGIDLQSPVAAQFKLNAVPWVAVYLDKVKVAEGKEALKWIADDVAKQDAAAGIAP